MWHVRSREQEREREICLGCSLGALCLLADYLKVLEKIVLERKEESMHSVLIGQCMAESLGGGIDLQEEIDL